MQIMRVYIAGPIAGQSNPRAAFEEAVVYIQSQGHMAMNPFDIPPHSHVGPCPTAGYPPGEGEDEHSSSCCYMRADLGGLLLCDAIYTLSGWEKSRGARVEVAVAHSVGLLHYGTSGKDVIPGQVESWHWVGIPTPDQIAATARAAAGNATAALGKPIVSSGKEAS